MGRILAVGARLVRARGEPVLDGGDAHVAPGWVDHHLHLHALAAAATSARCGPPDVADRVGLAAALAASPGDGHGWVRGVGYCEAVAGRLDGDVLDALHPGRPVRVQDRSGALWTVNGRAARILGLDTAGHPGVERDARGRATGRIWRADAWLRSRLPRSGPPDLSSVGDRLSRHGVTAVTDATPDLDPVALAHLTAAVADGVLPQRLHLLGVPLGERVHRPRVTTGPFKLVIEDSDLPDLDALTGRIRAAHQEGRPVAVHCVSREAAVLLVAAFTETGTVPGDRVEHAALVPDGLRHDFARLGVVVVTQPGFLTDRGDDFLRDVDPAEHDDLYRCAGLLDVGVPIALSSDAPYGPLDPEIVVAAAHTRRVPSGAVAGPGERLGVAQARGLLLAPVDRPGGPPSRIAVGHPADLVLRDDRGAVIELIVDGEPRSAHRTR